MRSDGRGTTCRWAAAIIASAMGCLSFAGGARAGVVTFSCLTPPGEFCQTSPGIRHSYYLIRVEYAGSTPTLKVGASLQPYVNEWALGISRVGLARVELDFGGAFCCYYPYGYNNDSTRHTLNVYAYY